MRIYPLYSLIVLLFISISCYIYLPSDLLVQAKQSIAAVLLIPNYYFMNNLDVSYFSVDAKNALFLHLWSVGVEVQNYIIWGLLFFLISGRKTACKITVLTLIAVASFYYSQRQLTTDPMVSFYSPR